ncbi:MAG: PAS domain S-box protein [Myxococcaceae bacterium]|nr:PAS domain S-box protein [Myxococcaceae bacterium]
MKTSAPKQTVARGVSAAAFEAFFDMIDRPAALCDADWVVLAANAAFETLFGRGATVGRSLRDVMTAVPKLPASGRSIDLDVTCDSGQVVTLTFARKKGAVAVVARHLAPAVDSLAAAGRALMEQARLEQALLELGREVAGAMSEEALVAAVARGVKGIFPGRTFCVRITDPRTYGLTSLYAEGRLAESSREGIVLKKSAAEKTHLQTDIFPARRVRFTTDEVPLLFEGSVQGICAPLVASGQLFGAINVEYPRGMTADLVTDDRILIQLANQVAVAVRNAKLIDELSFVRKYLEELLEHANALILVVNRDRRVVVFNKAVSTLTGWSKQEVLGQDIFKIIAESDQLKLARVLSASTKGEAVSNAETALLCKNGKEVRMAYSTSSVTSQMGEVEGVIAIGQDLTRMRELERRVVQAEKLASLGQLAASVVHEINNPMTAVVTYADALLKRSMGQPDAPASDVDKYKKIIDNSERVLRFTRDLVSYARPAKEKPEEVDLNAIAERAIGLCEHVLQKHAITVDRHFADIGPFVAVRQHLVQVLVNLITNACHATAPHGHISVTTRPAGEMVELVVGDTGSGISAQHLGRIFEPFFTTKADGKGTGLGLSIVQGIVENHGGTVTVKSELEKGTEFTIRLPFVAL